jgi:tubulin polyglutamylase TTLL1
MDHVNNLRFNPFKKRRPPDKARGIGIFIINRLSQVKKWAAQSKLVEPQSKYVVSKYIENPFLIGGKKFDLRLYVLVKSWRPLAAYKFDQGFARFCSERYSYDTDELDNNFIHLTNVSIQKYGDDYHEGNGGKFNYKHLMLYIEGTRGHAIAEKLENDINSVLIHTLRAIQPLMPNDKHCFEVYGYDIIIDSALHPWLIEVNSSPSMSATTSSDRIMKHELIDSVLKIVMPEGGEKDLGGFSVLIED